MAISAAPVAYCVTGGLVLYSGIKGATIAATVKAALAGNLTVTPTETIDFSSGSASPGGTGTDAGSSSASASANQVTAKSIIAKNSAYSGWDSGRQWSDLVALWNRESGWSATADNPASGAYGIPQALGHGTGGAPYPASYKNANPPKYGGTSNPGEQIEWGLDYIRSRYGSPELAWGHEQQQGWY